MLPCHAWLIREFKEERGSSQAHVSQTAKHLLSSLIFLHMFAEWAVALFHVGELILILDKEVAAVLTHGDGHVWNHVLEVALGHVRAEVTHVLDEDLLEAHVPHDLLADNHRTVVIRILLVVHPLENCLGEQVIFKTFVLVVLEGHSLLILSCGSPVLSLAFTLLDGWVHPEEFLGTHWRDAWIWDKLHERELIEAGEVP